jgi:thiosulfate oxidation carrier complex protein SoxZ
VDARLQLPEQVTRGQVFAVRIVIRHPMETGFRFDQNGKTIAANWIERFTARYGGKQVFAAELGSGVGANPYMVFHVRASESGDLVCEWKDTTGVTGQASARVNVS